MRRSFHFVVALLLIQCAAPTAPPEVNNKFQYPQIREIFQYQDQRSAQLQTFLTHEDSILRAAAAEAYASVQDMAAGQDLVSLLEDPSETVRGAAAYALGQLYDINVQDALIGRISQEHTISVKNQLLEALGKCSNEQGLWFLSQWTPRDTRVETGLAWGIYRCGLKGLQSPDALRKVVSLLSSEHDQARLGAAHYLARTRNLQLSDYAKEIQAASNDPLPEVRMALALALGKTGPVSESKLTALISQDPDYRVRINAIRGLSALPNVTENEELLAAVKDSHAMVALTAVNLFQDFGGAEMTDTLEILADFVTDKRVSAALLGAALKHASVKSGLTAKIQDRLDNTVNAYYKAHYLQALAENPYNHAFLAGILFGDHPAIITTTAINGLLKINGHPQFDEALKDDFAGIYQRAIESGDVAMVGIAAQALRNPDMAYKDQFENLEFLEQAMQKLVLPRDIETYLELQKTVNYLKDSTAVIPVELSHANPIDWDRVQNIPKDQLVSINTDRGEIIMEMLVEQSPGTVAFILELMADGFYEGKSFHRVVPNFVAQGGCPRGDGWGSTEQTLRSELGPSKYQTGSVGMASAGKDTESCQWFITHSPTPHLDGRYTIFAQVVKGMEVVHKLQVGDRIEKITILEKNEI
ncbi:MAG: peptidylprolyl isomerase [Cyclobacteriaceae bacterium]|nr:peptidylprolyl isomerase [Cyclobacteriaceae bacterium]